MSRQKRRDTKAELLVRRELHSRGVRFRVDVKLEDGLRTRGDIVWRGIKLVVFIDGCFWHGCPLHATRPAANAAWWAAKLDANIARDRRTDAALRERGWTVLRFWEHQPAAEVADEIVERLGAQRSRR
jgi:DNA mismatch endonuclease (patch repair protein)